MRKQSKQGMCLALCWWSDIFQIKTNQVLQVHCGSEGFVGFSVGLCNKLSDTSITARRHRTTNVSNLRLTRTHTTRSISLTQLITPPVTSHAHTRTHTHECTLEHVVANYPYKLTQFTKQKDIQGHT